MFRLSTEPIEAHSSDVGQSSGAVVTFEGLVRNTNEGKPVTALHYEAMEELATKEGSRIIEEAKEKFDIHEASCIHRTGLLQLGERAIFVHVSAGHRQAAFDACRYIVDQVKARVPIWKKEFYEGGETDWINAQGTST